MFKFIRKELIFLSEKNLILKRIICVICMHKHYKTFQLYDFNLHYKLSLSEAKENSSEQNKQQQNNIIPGYKRN